MATDDSECDRINEVGRQSVCHSDNEGLAITEFEVSFDGMLPDPIVEADFVDRMESLDSA
jgi:hypothetical protein